MKSKIRQYESDLIEVRYDILRCIHAEECIKRLATVFDSQARPWIRPEQDQADRVAETVEHCPSGALHYVRKDGAKEAIPETNTIILSENGPLYVRGNVMILDANETPILEDTRVALCRCGASQNKPLCDNSHKAIQFSAPQRSDIEVDETTPSDGGQLTITATQNGSLHIVGNVTIYDSQNRVIFAGDETWLCRCGGSANKPFCDSSHKRIGFQAE
ncbi:MAG: CDGSH iron-sulfur domain-containing protein [Chloroflexota bacterium]